MTEGGLYSVRTMGRSTAETISSSMLFRKPTQTEIVGAVVADVIAGRAVVAVRGDRGVGKTTQMRVIASKLGMQQRTVIMTSGVSASPVKLLRLIGEAVGMADALRLSPDCLLEALQSADNPERVVLLIDDIEELSSGMFHYLGLLIELFDLRPIKLQLILFGPLGQWPGLQDPDLELMRQATFSRHVIYAAAPLSPSATIQPVIRHAGSSTGLYQLPVPHTRRASQSVAGKWIRRASISSLCLLFVIGAAVTVLVNGIETVDPTPNRAIERHLSAPMPAVAPAQQSSKPDLPNKPAEVEEAVAIPTINPTAPHTEPAPVQDYVAPSRIGGPGLVLVAAAGDDLPNLYARVYRGLKPPPYLQVVAANRMPLKPGTLVVFPEPPAGWIAQ